MFLGSQRPQATGTEGAERTETAQLCFSCHPQREEAHPIQPLKMSSHPQGASDLSCLFSRSQGKDFSARLVIHKLVNNQKQPQPLWAVDEGWGPLISLPVWIFLSFGECSRMARHFLASIHTKRLYSFVK